MADLITNARARLNVTGATSTEDAVINTLISAASRAIQRYCRRDFAVAAYDELYNGTVHQRLLLRQYPIISVESVRHQLATVLTITNTSTLQQQARVAVTDSGLVLVRVSNGVKSSNTILFAGNVTLSAASTTVNALGNGWLATVAANYGNWPSADLYKPHGALPALGTNARLKTHAGELTGYHIDAERGWLVRAASQDNHSPWPGDVHNLRVQYTAGYDPVPEDIQEACAELVAIWHQQRGRDVSLLFENTAGTYSYKASEWNQLPDRIRAILRPYRHHILLNGA